MINFFKLIKKNKEVFRKVIHLCAAFIPILLKYFYQPILILLSSVLILYVVAEFLRYKGINVPIFSVITQTAARKRDGFLNGSTPIILGWPRAQMPQAIAMMAEVELHELKQDNVCPVIDRSAEFTWNYTFYRNYEISVQRIPQQVKSNVKTYDMNCSHPYALIDYFKHPVPGTLVWNKNNAYVIADKTAHFKSYTVLRQDGHILNADPQKLSTQNTSSGIQYYNSVDSKCSCLSIDPALPEKYQACGSQKDPFTCCDNLLRTDMQTERENLQNQYHQADEATKASIQSRLSLLQNDNYIQRQIYAMWTRQYQGIRQYRKTFPS